MDASTGARAPGVEPPNDNELRDSKQIFSRVAKSFRDSLPAKEKALFQEFEAPNLMIKTIRDAVEADPSGRKLSKLCSKIERFAAALAPFFDVINVIVSSHPEFAALAWGAVRLVLLLGSNHALFFEKLAAMFEKIGDRLPAYGEYYDRVLQRWKGITAPVKQKQAFVIRSQRLVKSLAYVYADIVQFCQEACKIFSSKKGGIRYQVGVILDLFWKPFDARFQGLLERLSSHETLFNIQMQHEESTFMEMQFDKQDTSLGMAKDHMEQILREVSGLKETNRSREVSICLEFKKIESRLREVSERLSRDGPDLAAESAQLKSRVAELKDWINAPDYLDDFNRARSKRTARTCEWVVSLAAFREWHVGIVHEHKPLGPPSRYDKPPILFINAKPGFGKTVLSSFIIEHLASEGVNSDRPELPQPVLFYYFTSDRPDSTSPSCPWRAILCQLIQSLKDCQQTIDALSIVYDKNLSGQPHASADEVLECLALLLQQHPNVILLIDGVDECVETDEFLDQLHDLCRVTATKAVILGRPSIPFPHSFNNFVSLNVDRSHNHNDIERYAAPEIALLQRSSLISKKIAGQDIVSTIVKRSHGMFLWAFLLIRYLNCPALTPNERRDTIFNTEVVEGLEGLYHRILTTLGKCYTKQREKIRKIFLFLIVARRPLSVAELQCALAVNPGSVTDEGDLIPNLKASLPVMCGALVEATEQDTVGFIHSSFKEFLCDTDSKMANSPFRVNIAEAHIRLASVCLSVLTLDIPYGPLKLFDEKSDNLWAARVLYPLLEYSLYWSHHFYSGIHSPVFQGSDGDLISKLFELTSKFLSQPSRVTTWIEVSWIFKTAPSISVVVEELRSSENVYVISEMREYPRLRANLERCDADLRRLNREWGHLLLVDPTAIWKSSVSAFTQSDFYYRTDGAVVSSLVPPEVLRNGRAGDENAQDRGILIQSQVSESGTILGTIVVIPSREYVVGLKRFSSGTEPSKRTMQLTPAQIERFITAASVGWKVKYRWQSTLNEAVLLDIEHEPSKIDIYELLCQGLTCDNPDHLSTPVAPPGGEAVSHRFPFPVSLSKDLKRVVILRTLITVVDPGDCEDKAAAKQSYESQTLTKRSPNKTDGHERRGPTPYSSILSPSSKTVAFVTSASSEDGPIQNRLVEIWSLNLLDERDLTYVLRGSVKACWLKHRPGIEDRFPGFLFHPSLPLIANSEWNRISIWWYNDQRPEDRIFLSSTLGVPRSFINATSLQISTWDTGDWRTLAPLDDMRRYSNYKADAPQSKYLEVNIWSVTTLFLDKYQDLTAPSAQLSVLSEIHGAGTSSDSRLERHPTTNAVVLSTAESGEDRTKAGGILLTHLPRLHTGEQTYVSLLPMSAGDEWARLIYNKSTQKSYSMLDPVNPYVPSIISKRVDVIAAESRGGTIRSTLKRGAADEDEVDDAEGRQTALVKRRLGLIWRGHVSDRQ